MKYKYGERRGAGEYEKALIEFWKKDGTFEKSVEKGEKDYVFYDGPPFITGSPHHGTLLSSIVKDAVPRFWTMRGYRVERRWGWDCHGLPAENFVEKHLGGTVSRVGGRELSDSATASPTPAVAGSARFTSAEPADVVESDNSRPGQQMLQLKVGDKVSEISLQKYIETARELMRENSETWESTVDRIGRWVDFRGAYKTMDKDFMESVWWAFAELYKKGKIYEGMRVLMYDTTFATPVSKNEITMDNDAYRTVTDPSVYVKFHLKAGQKYGEGKETKESAYLLAWTTTPWTLPSNQALAVNPELTYTALRVDGVKELLIVVSKLVEKVFEGHEVEIVHDDIIGNDLVGMEYESLFGLPGDDKAYKVYAAEFVGVEEGTGIVHIAPAYGEADFELAGREGIPVRHVIDDNGYYLPEVAEKLREIGVRDTDERGIEMWAANKHIAKCLEEKGVVWKIDYVQHEYPFNPRSGQRIMYRAIPSWFFDVTGDFSARRDTSSADALLARSMPNTARSATPAFSSDARTEQSQKTTKEIMLEENEKINWFPEYLKYGRFAKNIEQAPDWNLSRDRFWATPMPVWEGDKGTVKVVGSYDELYELSGVRLEDYHRPWVDEVEFDVEGEHFKRIEKVLDCWFESGSMPFAQLHYPFENKEKFEKNYPADFIVEYVGQVRAWFYYVHVINTVLFGENAYRNVITTGTLAGSDGRKMSKSLGNFTDPLELLDEYSADALRFLLLSSPVLSGEDFALVDKDVSDVQRKLNMIWNMYDFFCMYAEVDKWDSDSGFSEDTLRARPSSRGAVAGVRLEVDDQRSSLPQLLQNLESESPQNASSQIAEAPSMIDSESHLPEPAEVAKIGISVPNSLKNPLDVWIVSRLSELQNQITEGMEAYNIPEALSGVLPFVDDASNWYVRRSRRRFWKSEDDEDKADAYATLHYVLSKLAILLAPFVPFLAEELWQKMVGGGESVHLQDWPMNTTADSEVLEQMGRTREIITEGLALRMNKSETEGQIKVRQPLSELVYGGEKLDEFYEGIIAEEVNVKRVVHGDGMKLDKVLTDELRDEGFARELIRCVQAARKKAGLQVDDRIRLSLSEEVPGGFGEMVKEEVLAIDMSVGENYGYDEIVKIGDRNVTISLEKA